VDTHTQDVHNVPEKVKNVYDSAQKVNIVDKPVAYTPNIAHKEKSIAKHADNSHDTFRK